MATVASLGLAVDSRPVGRARDELGRFVSSANQADQAGRKFSSGTEQMNRGLRSLFKELDASRKEWERFIKTTNGAGPANDNFNKSIDRSSQSLKRYRADMVNMTRQIQDVVVSIGSGQALGTVALQQGAQILDILGNSDKTAGKFFGDMARGAASFITPGRLVVFTLGAIAAAVYAAYSSWKTYAKQLDDTARIAGVAANEMAKLQGAAGVKGIDKDKFAEGVGGFAAELYRARTGAGDLAMLLRANGQYAGDFETTLGRVADLIKNAGSDQQRLVLLQQAGLPATMDWVKFLSQGADGIRRAKGEMVGLAAGHDEMLKKQRELDEAWNKFWSNTAQRFRNLFVTVVTWVQSIITELSRAYNKEPPQGTRINIVVPFSEKPNGKPTVDPAELQRLNALEQQRLGILSQMLTVQQQIRQVELQVAAARLNGVNVSKAEEENLKRLAAERALGIDQIKAYRDQLEIQAKTFGMTAGQAYAYQVVQEKINEAKRNGTSISMQYLQQVQQEAERTGALIDKQSQLDSLRSTARGFAQDLVSGLQQGKSLTDALTGAFKNLSSQLASSALTQLFSGNLFGAAISGIGALVSGLFGGGSNNKLEAAVNSYRHAASIVDRTFNATHDSGSYQDQMILMERRFEQERLEEMYRGGQAIGELIKAQNAEKEQLERQFRERELDRLRGYEDRLFSAANDNSSLAGALAAFDRQAQRDREAEIKAGGAQMTALEAALAAERLNIIKDFATRAAEEERRRADERREQAAAQLANAESALSQARSDLSSVYEREKSAIESIIDATTQWMESLRKLKNSLLLDNRFTPLNPQQQYLEAQRQYREIYARAMGGDKDAQGQVEQALTTYLEQSRAFNASTVAYYQDFEETQRNLAELEDTGNRQLSAAQQQLAVLNQQVAGLMAINNSVMTVEQAVQNVRVALQDYNQAQSNVNNQRDWGVRPLVNQWIQHGLDAAGISYTGNYGPNSGFQEWVNSQTQSVQDQIYAIARSVPQYLIDYYNRTPSYASGTDFHPGGMAWVGEQGRELVNLPRGSQVIPHTTSMRMASNDNGAVVAALGRLETRMANVEQHTRAGAAVSAASGDETIAILKELLQAAQDENKLLRRQVQKMDEAA